LKYVKEESNSEEIIKLKVELEEAKKVEDILLQQIKEKGQEFERLEEEVLIMKKIIEKAQTNLNMNIPHIKGSEKLDLILNSHRFPLMKAGLGYEGEYSETMTEDKKTFTFVKSIKGDNDIPHQYEKKSLSNTSTSNEKKQRSTIGKVHKTKGMENQTTNHYRPYFFRSKDYEMSRWLYPQMSSTTRYENLFYGYCYCC